MATTYRTEEGGFQIPLKTATNGGETRQDRASIPPLLPRPPSFGFPCSLFGFCVLGWPSGSVPFLGLASCLGLVVVLVGWLVLLVVVRVFWSYLQLGT